MSAPSHEKNNKNNKLKKASQYFTKLSTECDLDKYKLGKDNLLFELSSFQKMHDADLAYHHMYLKCAESAFSKESLLRCLELELKSVMHHPDAFNADFYKQNIARAIEHVEQQLKNGSLDYLFT